MRPQPQPHGHPIAELVLTVLSQSTNDRNRDVAYMALRERFPSWEHVRDAPVDEMEEAIRPGGISKVKSARIKSILRAISETAPERGASADDPLCLDWLTDQSVSAAREPFEERQLQRREGGEAIDQHCRRPPDALRLLAQHADGQSDDVLGVQQPISFEGARILPL